VVGIVVAAVLMFYMGLSTDASGSSGETDGSVASAGETTTTEEPTTTTTTIPISPDTTVADYDPTEPGDVRVAGSFYGPIQTGFEGLTMFRGNASRTYYGEGPVPTTPHVLWKFGPMRGSNSEALRSPTGTGWTGQPAVFEREGKTWVVFGAYDFKIHFLDADTGEKLLPDFKGGDLFKGSAVVDPDGYPLVYMGCADDKWRIIAIDRDVPTALYTVNSRDLPNPLWYWDWDSSVVIRNDYAFQGCENSHFYIFKLNRGYDAQGKVTVDPEVVLDFPAWTKTQLKNLGSNDVSVENSPCLVGDRLYFSNSGGLLSCLDVSATLEELPAGQEPATGLDAYPLQFQFWTGGDADPTIVADEQGYIYLCQHSDKGHSSFSRKRANYIGQIVKFDPRQTGEGENPVVWSKRVTQTLASDGESGVWATPTLYKDMLYVSTHSGSLLGIDRETGDTVWKKSLSYHDWASCAVIDGTLIAGDTNGVLHAWDVSDTRVDPPKVWSLKMAKGALESTPAVWKGRIYVGSRDGYFYCIGDY